MSNLVDYAKNELKRIGMVDSGEPYNDWATKAILDLIKLFDSQDHSGFSAPYVINAFSRLAMFKPLSPLTGEDDEWNEVGTGVFQNKRYSAVFKDKDGVAYNIEGKAFTDDGKTWYTCRESRVNVTFPYVVPDTPERVYRNKEKGMKYVVIMQDDSVGYGEYVHLIGIFDTHSLAEIAITKCKEHIKKEDLGLVDFVIIETETNKINCPYSDERFGYHTDCFIGGYSE